ncbi:hypothetical protein L9F63_017590, partial [Diploptera punctata]
VANVCTGQQKTMFVSHPYHPNCLVSGFLFCSLHFTTPTSTSPLKCSLWVIEILPLLISIEKLNKNVSYTKLSNSSHPYFNLIKYAMFYFSSLLLYLPTFCRMFFNWALDRIEPGPLNWKISTLYNIII